MTFCLGVNLEEGLLGISDTRVLFGHECVTARKVSVFHIDGRPLFIMTSGMRSLRDEALTYFEELIEKGELAADRLFRVVNAFASQMRRLADEHKEALSESGQSFNLHALIGGQLERDSRHRLYMAPPAGTWIEIGKDTPYHIIGDDAYGKPVLDQTLKHADSLRHALKAGCLAFDSARLSAAAVGYPIDVVLYRRDSGRMIEHRYDKLDLQLSMDWWEDRLRSLVHELPAEWVDDVLVQFDAGGRDEKGFPAQEMQPPSGATE